MKRPVETYFLGFLLVFLAAGAIYGGGTFILKPDGSLLQMDKSWLDNSSFDNFLVPGIILFVLLGLFPLLALSGLFIKKTVPVFNFLNIFSDKHWGWTFTLYSGIISIVWIVIQQLLTNYFVLQPVIAGNGILIIIICLVPRVQKYYSNQTK